MTKKGLVVIFIFLGIATGVFLVVGNKEEPEPVVEDPVVTYPIQKTIGSSVQGNTIESFTWGEGDTHIAFVGGIHGGYEWNSVLLAYEFIDYFNEHPEIIPENITVTIIPVANPDGLYRVLTSREPGERFTEIDIALSSVSADQGRFNANNVDLNRNFDCKWQPESTWRGDVVSAGTSAFSEPEARAIRDFVTNTNPEAVVFWHSKANNVYASECLNGPLTETLDIMNVYATAADYGAVPSFDAYPVTGDAEGWLASIGIPAVTVELETRNSIEWQRNLAGVMAIFEYYSQE